MPADHKVSVAWQIVALFVPIANFWAFYRIRKLRKYLLYVFLPSLVVSGFVLWYISDRGIWAPTMGYQDSVPGDPAYVPYTFDFLGSPLYVASTAISWALFGLSIYLVVKWSREHNHKFSATTQTGT